MSRTRDPLTSEPYFRGGDGEPLVLLHGGTDTWHTWEDVLPLLTPHHDVLAPTLPGHSGGPALPGRASIELFADGAEAVMDEAGFATAHLAGNSLGGWVAMELARRERARSVVALSPAGGWTPPARRLRRISVSSERQIRFGKAVLPLMLRPPALRRMAFRRFARRGDRLTPEQALQGCLRALDADFALVLSMLKSRVTPYPDPGVRVLLAWAEHDRLLPSPKYSDAWRAAAPFAEWRILPGVGHVPMIDDPQLVAQTIHDWAKR
jgi:pimeloyl-ACP methyl ester carboxylesterase